MPVQITDIFNFLHFGKRANSVQDRFTEWPGKRPDIRKQVKFGFAPRSHRRHSEIEGDGEGGYMGSTEFWSHWSWPLATAIIGLYFSWLVLKQYFERRKPQQLAWFVGLVLYAVGAVMESYSEYAQVWNPTVYKFYYVIAASLVGFLGLGTVYLVFGRRTWGYVFLIYLAVLAALFRYSLFNIEVAASLAGLLVLGTVYLVFGGRNWGHLFLAYLLVLVALFLYSALRADLIIEKLVPGITVGGEAMPDNVRAFSFLFTIPGTFFLFGGAIYSVILFAAKREYAYRMWANVLIAIGTTVIATAGGMARTGRTVGLYPAEMVGAAFLLWGFLKAGTLRKGPERLRAKGES